MAKTRSLKTKLSAIIALIVLVTVATISVLSNLFLKQKYISTIQKAQEQQALSIVTDLSQQFSEPEESASDSHHSSEKKQGTGRGIRRNEAAGWKMENVDNIGTAALNNGFIVRVKNLEDDFVWDANQRNHQKCRNTVEDISTRMNRHHQGEGEFVTTSYPLMQGDQQIGTVEISHYGPYFLSESDFQFLDSLNVVLFGVGGISLVLSILIGIFLAQKMSEPILNTSQVAQQMAGGDYQVRISEDSKTTELRQLMISINHLAETLDQQETLRQQLTADVAHELRTPLTTMSTHVEAMIEGVWEPTPERLQSLYEELGRMTHLIKDLENLAKADGDNLHLQKEPTDLLELASTVLENFDYEIAEKKLELSLQEGETLALVDPERFYQVIYNLVSNAIKYNRPGGSITIASGTSEAGPFFSVSDTGIGIAPEDLPYIFERFYRVEKSRNRATGGSGIGMAVVASIVKAHGGNVQVSSQLHEGSTFTVTLPPA